MNLHFFFKQRVYFVFVIEALNNKLVILIERNHACLMENGGVLIKYIFIIYAKFKRILFIKI